jgi:transcriptional regulator with XRE-family HTH domain
MSDPSQRALYREVGSKIREARERLGLTQQGLATEVSLSRTSITNIEQGRQTILVHQLVAFARALNLEAVALLPASAIERAVNPPADIIQRLKPKDREATKQA